MPVSPTPSENFGSRFHRDPGALLLLRGLIVDDLDYVQHSREEMEILFIGRALRPGQFIGFPRPQDIAGEKRVARDDRRCDRPRAMPLAKLFDRRHVGLVRISLCLDW